MWSASSFKCNHSLEGHSKSVKCLFVTGNVLISGSNDGTIRVSNSEQHHLLCFSLFVFLSGGSINLNIGLESHQDDVYLQCGGSRWLGEDTRRARPQPLQRRF